MLRCFTLLPSTIILGNILTNYAANTNTINTKMQPYFIKKINYFKNQRQIVTVMLNFTFLLINKLTKIIVNSTIKL